MAIDIHTRNFMQNVKMLNWIELDIKLIRCKDRDEMIMVQKDKDQIKWTR